MTSDELENKIIFNMREGISGDVYCTSEEMMNDAKLLLKKREGKDEPQIMIYPGTGLYLGGINLKNQFREGYGIMKWYMPEDYKGEWSMYEGCWDNDMPSGYGIRTAFDGVTITGKFINGEPNGYCIFKDPLGCIIEGDFIDGNLTGKGKQYYGNGKIWYIGDYVNWQREGYGTLFLENGDIYEGAFKDSKYHGEGKYTDFNGNVIIGERNDGVLLNHKILK